MRHMNFLTMLALTGVLALGMASLSARAVDEAPAKKAVGSISGKVVDKDGNGIAEDKIRAQVKHEAAAHPTADQPKDGKKPAPKMDTVAEAKTAADGTFTLTNVPEGTVRVVAGKKGFTEGVVKEVVVVADKETKLADPITLIVKEPKPK
ncbi:MAG: carboxypeptidase-like regulatory domain-containing protein [Phycisphaerae bacterium]